MVWYFIGIYIRDILGDILVLKNTALTREIRFNTRREISYLRAAM